MSILEELLDVARKEHGSMFAMFRFRSKPEMNVSRRLGHLVDPCAFEKL